MSPEDVVGLAIAATVVLVPILAISARVALRPIVDSLVRLQQAFGSTESAGAKKRIDDLEQQVHVLTEQVRRLEDAEAFRSELETSGSTKSLPAGSKAGTSA